MKYFCSNCGKTTQYGIELPKFCAFCGQSFANKPASLNTENQRNKFLNELKLKKNINLIKADDDDVDNSENIEEENYNINNFKNIKPSFKVNVYQNKGESFGSLLDNPSKPINTIENTYTQSRTKEEILAEFQKEAGSLRSV